MSSPTEGKTALSMLSVVHFDASCQCFTSWGAILGLCGARLLLLPTIFCEVVRLWPYLLKREHQLTFDTW
jgi:hypothetical protein